MITLTKERIIQAFTRRQRKRNNLLYEYYKQEVFDKGYSALVIADMITQDLGFPITPHMIYNINKRIINPGNKNKAAYQQSIKPLLADPSLPPNTHSDSIHSDIDTKGMRTHPDQEARKNRYRNAEDENKNNSFSDLMKDL